MKNFSIGGVNLQVTDLNNLVSSVPETERANVLDIAKKLVPSGIKYVTEDDNSKDPARTVVASAILNRHLLLE